MQTPREYFSDLRSSNAADRAGNDRTARVCSEREGENDVPNGQMARVEDPESAEASHQRESDDVVVGTIVIISGSSRARRLSELPGEVSRARSDGYGAGDQVENNQTKRKEVRQEEENAHGHDGDPGTTLIHDEESMATSPGRRRDDVHFHSG